MYFSNSFVYALLPEEQQLAVLPPKHLRSGVTNETIPTPNLPNMLHLEGHSTELGEHQSSAMATIYLHFLLDNVCLCISVFNVCPLLPSAINDFLPIYL